MTTEDKSIFKPLAESQMTDLAKENKAFVDQLLAHEFALEEMSKDPKMTAKAWRRAIKAFHNYRKSGVEPVKFQHPVEEAVAKNLRNQLGLGVQLMVRQEAMVKEVTENMRRIKEEAQKAAEQAQINVESPFSTESDDLSKGETNDQ